MGMRYRCAHLATGALLVCIGTAYPSIASALDTSAEEIACSELGFKKKTPAFANCVVELYDRKKQNAATDHPSTAQDSQIATDPPPAGEPQQNIATAQENNAKTTPATPTPAAKTQNQVVSFEDAAEGAVKILFELAKFGLFW